jgi:hypothetical protein
VVAAVAQLAQQLGKQIEFIIIFLLKWDWTTVVDIVANDGMVALLFNCRVPLDLPTLPGFNMGCSKGGRGKAHISSAMM